MKNLSATVAYQRSLKIAFLPHQDLWLTVAKYWVRCDTRKPWRQTSQDKNEGPLTHNPFPPSLLLSICWSRGWGFAYFHFPFKEIFPYQSKINSCPLQWCYLWFNILELFAGLSCKYHHIQCLTFQFFSKSPQFYHWERKHMVKLASFVPTARFSASIPAVYHSKKAQPLGTNFEKVKTSSNIEKIWL